MPASLYAEEQFLKVALNKEAFPVLTEVFVGLATWDVGEAELKKSTTGTEYEAQEPKIAQGWARIGIVCAAAQYEAMKKTGTAAGASKLENKNPVKFKPISAGTYELKSFAICDAVTVGNILFFGKLTTPVTINSATTEFTIPAKQLIIECE